MVVKLAWRAERLEDDAVVVGLDLLVKVDIDNKAGRVLDDGSVWSLHATLLGDDQADLGAGDTQSPEALAMSREEALQRFLDVLQADLDCVNEAVRRQSLTQCETWAVRT
jgi:hypothetical protein